MTGVELMQDLVMNFLQLLVGMVFAGAFGFLLLVGELAVQKNVKRDQFTAFMFFCNSMLFFVILLFWHSKW